MKNPLSLNRQHAHDKNRPLLVRMQAGHAIHGCWFPAPVLPQSLQLETVRTHATLQTYTHITHLEPMYLRHGRSSSSTCTHACVNAFSNRKHVHTRGDGCFSFGCRFCFVVSELNGSNLQRVRTTVNSTFWDFCLCNPFFPSRIALISTVDPFGPCAGSEREGRVGMGGRVCVSTGCVCLSLSISFSQFLCPSLLSSLSSSHG